MAELAIALRQLFAGEALKRADIPLLFLFSFKRRTIRAPLQNPVADPSLLRSESPQARSARTHSTPFRRRNSANSLWDY